MGREKQGHQAVSYVGQPELSKKGNFMSGVAWLFIWLCSWQYIYSR